MSHETAQTTTVVCRAWPWLPSVSAPSTSTPNTISSQAISSTSTTQRNSNLHQINAISVAPLDPSTSLRPTSTNIDQYRATSTDIDIDIVTTRLQSPVPVIAVLLLCLAEENDCGEYRYNTIQDDCWVRRFDRVSTVRASPLIEPGNCRRNFVNGD